MTGTRIHLAPLALAAAVVLAGSIQAAGPRDSLKKGDLELQSLSAMAFGPEGILFIGDARAAAIVALDTQDHTAAASTDRPKVESIDEKIASMLGIEAAQLQINDLAVNPLSGNTYVGVTRGKAADSKPVLMRVDRSGKIDEVALKDVPFARVALPDAAAQGGNRQMSITKLAYAKGKLFVAGLSNEEFSSRFLAIAFPFTATEKGTAVEFYHGSHGRLETKSPIRTFVPYEFKGEENLLAAYTCTPLVQVPVAELKPGAKIKGKTIAELGNRNVPLDIIVYQKDGKDYLLMANSARGGMKIPTVGMDKVESITTRIGDKAGLKAEKVSSLDNAVQLDAFDKDHVLVLTRTPDKKFNLQTIELP
jgi:hypothetical protein